MPFPACQARAVRQPQLCSVSHVTPFLFHRAILADPPQQVVALLHNGLVINDVVRVHFSDEPLVVREVHQPAVFQVLAGKREDLFLIHFGGVRNDYRLVDAVDLYIAAGQRLQHAPALSLPCDLKVLFSSCLSESLSILLVLFPHVHRHHHLSAQGTSVPSASVC